MRTTIFSNIFKYAGLFLLTVTAVSCGGKGKKTAQETTAAPASYPTEVVSPQRIILENSYPVTLKGQEDIEIRPRIDGFIKNIYIDEGAVVKKGQRLFEIDSPSAVEGVTSARAAVTSSQSDLATAELNVERMRPLAEKNIISNVQLETYENQYRAAQAAVAQAQSSLSQAHATLGWTTVTSPVDGVAGTIPYRQGSLVSSSDVLTTVANTSNIFAYFSLNEKELLELLSSYTDTTQTEKIGSMPEVTLTLADGTVYGFKGRIETISGVLDTYIGSASLRAEFPNPAGILRSGMSGTLAIPTVLENTILVPQKATFAQQDKTLIYKVQADSVVQSVIEVLPTPDGQSFAVTRGLQDGDRIVTDGVATLSNGKKIAVQN